MKDFRNLGRATRTVAAQVIPMNAFGIFAQMNRASILLVVPACSAFLATDLVSLLVNLTQIEIPRSQRKTFGSATIGYA